MPSRGRPQSPPSSAFWRKMFASHSAVREPAYPPYDPERREGRWCR